MKLVITLSDGSTIETGLVTSDPNIQCESQDMSSNARSDQGGGGGDQGGSGDDNSDNNDDEDGGNANCSTANLTTGTAEFGAELQISSAGSVWKEIDLASSSTNSGDNGDNGDNGGNGGND